MRVLLRKVRGQGASAIVGTVSAEPTPGRPVVVAFHDGIHEFITSPVVRVMRVGNSGTLYIQTRNSVYRLEIRQASGRELPPATNKGGSG